MRSRPRFLPAVLLNGAMPLQQAAPAADAGPAATAWAEPEIATMTVDIRPEFDDPLTGEDQRRFSYPAVSRSGIASLRVRVQEPR